MGRVMVGPDKVTFLQLFGQAKGDFELFNLLMQELGEEPMALRTFQRRRSDWVTNVTTEDEVTDELEEVAKPVAGGTLRAPDKRREKLTGKRYVFTAAQNNTFVHEQFWENLLTYCEFNDAELVVGRFTYNKNGFQNSVKDGDTELWYDPKVVPFVQDVSAEITQSLSGLVWCGELDILPTAANPLSGFDSYTHTASSIIPHAKVQLKSVPVMRGEPVKMLYTTGACTQRNYIQRKAGQKAEFHHVFGALVVEIDNDGDHFVRQLIADSQGNFQDLTCLYENGSVEEGMYVEAINWGDIHAEMMDEAVFDGCFGPDGMLYTLNPNYQFIHDLTDFKARNHHNIKNPHFLAEMHFEGTGNVEDGMRIAGEFLQYTQLEDCTTVVVESNHDQAFRRWLAEADIRQDPENAEYYHRYNAEIFKRIREGDYGFHVFEYAVREHVDLDNAVFLKEDDSLVICGVNGIECGMHGHRGPNGARGNPNALRAMGRKCNTGHTHSAAIIDGIYVAGISCKMDMGYNKGPSSWSHSHIVTYPNGKRTIVTMKNGKWCSYE